MKRTFQSKEKEEELRKEMEKAGITPHTADQVDGINGTGGGEK